MAAPRGPVTRCDRLAVRLLRGFEAEDSLGSARSRLSCPSSQRPPHSLVPGPATSAGLRLASTGTDTPWLVSLPPTRKTGRSERGCFPGEHRPGHVLPIKLVTAFPEAITESCTASQGEAIKESARGRRAAGSRLRGVRGPRGQGTTGMPGCMALCS